MIYENVPIPVYIINLRDRQDRLAHIRQQFADKPEFNTKIIEAYKHEIGAFGLWRSIKQVIKEAIEKSDDVIIICEDDHIFTSDYLKTKLLLAIEEARVRDADVLLGGVSWFSSGLPTTQNLYWVEKFSGLQFTVIFRKFYKTIMNTKFEHGDAADYKISALTDKKYFIFPFISAQKEFGYSDVTPKNNQTNRVKALFEDAAKRANAIKQVINFYRSKPVFGQSESDAREDFCGITISTYIISPSIKVEPKNHTASEFEDRSEFNTRFIQPCAHENDVAAYWLTLQGIVKHAIADDDDVIVICSSDHQFTCSYSRDQFIRDIINLHQLGTEVLCGGIDDFDMVVPVAKNKFWTAAFKASTFLILYKAVFDKILQTSLEEHSSKESLFRNLTSNKMVLFPFISIRKALENSPISDESLTSSKVVISRLTKIRDIALLSSLI